MRAACSAYLILLDFITLIMFGEAAHYAVFSILIEILLSEAQNFATFVNLEVQKSRRYAIHTHTHTHTI
jgi:hypothetical protein